VVEVETVMDHQLMEELVDLVVVQEHRDQLLVQSDLPLLLDKEILVDKVQPIMHRIGMVVAVVVLVVLVQMLKHQVEEVAESVFNYLAHSKTLQITLVSQDHLVIIGLPVEEVELV